jgi:hypothetical protein
MGSDSLLSPNFVGLRSASHANVEILKSSN